MLQFSRFQSLAQILTLRGAGNTQESPVARIPQLTQGSENPLIDGIHAQYLRAAVEEGGRLSRLDRHTLVAVSYTHLNKELCIYP